MNKKDILKVEGNLRLKEYGQNKIPLRERGIIF